jgi:hypothetical protein
MSPRRATLPSARRSSWVDRAGKVLGRAIDELLEDPRDPALSPDGTRLALSTGPIQQGDIWSYDLRGRPPIRLAVVDDDRHPSGAGQQARVFHAIRSATNANTYAVLADGSMLTPRPLRLTSSLSSPGMVHSGRAVRHRSPDPDRQHCRAVPCGG